MHLASVYSCSLAWQLVCFKCPGLSHDLCDHGSQTDLPASLSPSPPALTSMDSLCAEPVIHRVPRHRRSSTAKLPPLPALYLLQLTGHVSPCWLRAAEGQTIRGDLQRSRLENMIDMARTTGGQPASPVQVPPTGTRNQTRMLVTTLGSPAA